MIDRGSTLHQVPGHLHVVVDYGLQEWRPQGFVLGVYFSARLRAQTTSTDVTVVWHLARHRATQEVAEILPYMVPFFYFVSF